MTMQSTMSGFQNQMQAMQNNATAMGQAFDASKNDDSFYLPPEVFDNPDFKRGLKMFVSPDGKAVRFIISHEGDPATPEGISHIDKIKNAAFEALKGTPLEGSRVYLGGTASVYKDMQHGANYDLLIAGVAALCLIFIIMLVITRSAVAAAVTVPVIASGGVGTLDHLADGVQQGGADAVLAASIFHYGEFTVAQAKARMAERGIPVRI